MFETNLFHKILTEYKMRKSDLGFRILSLESLIPISYWDRKEI